MSTDTNILDDRLGQQATEHIISLGFSGLSNTSLNDYEKCKECIIYIFKYVGINISKIETAKYILEILMYPGTLDNIHISSSNELKLAVIWMSEAIRIIRDITNFSLSALAQKELQNTHQASSPATRKLDKFVIEDIVKFVGSRETIEVDLEQNKIYSEEETTVYSHDYLIILGILFRYMRSTDNTERFEREKKAIYIFCDYLLKYYTIQFVNYIQRENKELVEDIKNQILQYTDSIKTNEVIEQELSKKNQQIENDINQINITIQKLTTTSVTISQQIENEEIENNKLAEQVAELSEQWLKSQDEFTKNKNIIRHYETLQSNLNELDTNIKNLRNENEYLKKACNTEEQHSSEYKKNINDTYTEYRHKIKENVELVNENIQKFFNAKFLVTHLDINLKENNALDQILSFKNYIQPETDALKQKISDAKKQLLEIITECDRYDEQILALTKKKTEMEMSYLNVKKELSKQIDTIKSDISIIKSKIDFHQINRTRTERDYAQAKSEKEAKIELLKNEIRSLYIEYNNKLNASKRSFEKSYNTAMNSVHYWITSKQLFVNNQLDELWKSIYILLDNNSINSNKVTTSKNNSNSIDEQPQDYSIVNKEIDTKNKGINFFVQKVMSVWTE